MDPAVILEFWFANAASDPEAAVAREKLWFGSSQEADALIRDRFAPAIEAAARGELDDWTRDPHHALAANHLARLTPIEQAFLILPYQHSESLEHQRESVRLSVQIARAAAPAWRTLLDHYLDYARQHLALIERFGRFPHRNRVLGRTSTRDEDARLAEGGESFGQDSA